MNFFGTRVKDIMFRTEGKQMMSPVWLPYTILEKLLHAMNNKEAIWLYAELFLGHHDGSCHGLW